MDSSPYSPRIDEAPSTDTLSNLDCFGLMGEEVEIEHDDSMQQEYHYPKEAGPALAASDSLALQQVETVEDEIVNEAHEVALPGDEASYEEKQRRRVRMRLGMAVVLTVVVVILATVLSVTRNDDGDRSGVVSGVGGGDFVASDAPTEAPTPEPTPAPTSQKQNTMAYQVLKDLVPPELLLDPTTPQGKAFDQILLEGLPEDFAFRIPQRFALMATYFATGGDSWQWSIGWGDFADDECDWYGVNICRNQNGRRVASALHLLSNNLSGTIPEEICLLEGLESILFENNNLSGELPTCLSTLSNLFEFDVHHNSFSGSPPPGFFKLEKLDTLVLSNNQFSGGLSFLTGDQGTSLVYPAFTELKELKLDNNNFDGPVPAEISLLTALELLTLHGNSLTGDVSGLCDIAGMEDMPGC